MDAKLTAAHDKLLYNTYPGGTMPNVRSREPVDGSTLFAMANVLWKLSGLLSSNDQVDGSPAEVVHVMCKEPPEEALVGALIDRALTNGRRMARVLRRKHHVNINMVVRRGLDSGTRT